MDCSVRMLEEDNQKSEYVRYLETKIARYKLQDDDSNGMISDGMGDTNLKRIKDRKDLDKLQQKVQKKRLRRSPRLNKKDVRVSNEKGDRARKTIHVDDFLTNEQVFDRRGKQYTHSPTPDIVIELFGEKTTVVKALNQHDR